LEPRWTFEGDLRQNGDSNRKLEFTKGKIHQNNQVC